MSDFKTAMTVMENLFAKDCLFALATVSENRPEVRTVDVYYEKGAFYLVTYAKSAKVREMESNKHVALCDKGYRFTGTATNIGHPLLPGNALLRDKLIQVFAPWYFAHNNEADAHMCYVRIDLQQGFFYQDGTGYKVDFIRKKVETSPFNFELVLAE